MALNVEELSNGFRFKWFLLVLMQMLSMNCFAYYIAKENEDGVTIYYDLIGEDGNKELEVTYEELEKAAESTTLIKAKGYSGNVRIPEEISYQGSTLRVTSIAPWAFYKTSITAITIPKTIKKIGHDAFAGCNYLHSVYISSLEAWCNIEFNASNGGHPCDNGAHLYLNGQEIVNLVIPKTCSTIKKYAFRGCIGLKSVDFHEGVASIEVGAFMYCSNLSKINLPKHLVSINNYVFYNCKQLTSISIPEGVRGIGYYSFAETGLSSIKIPSSVEYLGYASKEAYRYEHSVSGGNKPGVGWSFVGCKNLKVVEFEGCPKFIDDNIFPSTVEKVVVRDLVTWCSQEVGYTAYGRGVGGIENYDLYIDENTKITELIIPKGIDKIRIDAFRYCKSIQSVIIPEGIKEIGYSSFENCSNLKKIVIPSTCTTIETSAFYFTNPTDELVEIYCYNEIPPNIRVYSDSPAFSSEVFKYGNLYVPERSVSAYRKHKVWGKFVWILNGVPTGIKQNRNADNVEAETSEAIFDLQGNKHVYKHGIELGSENVNLRKGIYIKKNKDGTSKKILIK